MMLYNDDLCLEWLSGFRDELRFALNGYLFIAIYKEFDICLLAVLIIDMLLNILVYIDDIIRGLVFN